MESISEIHITDNASEGEDTAAAEVQNTEEQVVDQNPVADAPAEEALAEEQPAGEAPEATEEARRPRSRGRRRSPRSR